MGIWGDILLEIGATKVAPAQASSSVSPQDLVRRKYLALAHQHTGRATILYATQWTQPSPGQPIPAEFTMLTNEDVQGFMEAVHDIDTDRLDLILHSPGGSPTAAEAVVKYLRTKFNHIRVIVPHMAMSAATMIACAADEIVMGAHSFLGPIDPQLPLNTSLGLRMVPAQAIIEQFEQAKEECQDIAKVRAWLPMLSQYGPDLLVSCQNASDLGEELVRQWLAAYMFRGDRDRKSKARAIAKWLATHSHFKSHGRPITREELQAKGVNIVPLERDQQAQHLYLSVFHAVSHTFTQTGAVKIIENHLGKAFIKVVQQRLVLAGQAPAQITAQPVQSPTLQEPQRTKQVKPKTKLGAKRAARQEPKAAISKKP